MQHPDLHTCIVETHLRTHQVNSFGNEAGKLQALRRRTPSKEAQQNLPPSLLVLTRMPETCVRCRCRTHKGTATIALPLGTLRCAASVQRPRLCLLHSLPSANAMTGLVRCICIWMLTFEAFLCLFRAGIDAAPCNPLEIPQYHSLAEE